MNEQIAKQLLILTKAMQGMAINDEWELFADNEKQRSQLIEETKIMYGGEFSSSEPDTIALLEEIIAINQEINKLSEEKLSGDKNAILQLQKSKKASQHYRL
jgi:hypothetical protein